MKAPKVDANQGDIVEGLRAIGANVELLHMVGKGCPDILVGFRGLNYLIEIKNGKGKLNPRQVEWHEDWNAGQVAVAWTLGDAKRIIGAID